MQKHFFKFEIGHILIDLNKIFPMEPSELKMSGEKTA